MNFSESVSGPTLYTNNHFTGKSTDTYNITNNSSTTLTIKIHEYSA